MSRALLVFLKHTLNGTKELFTNGKPLFIGSLNPYSQMYNDDGVEWDEFQLIKYSNKRNYKKDVSEFDDIKNNFMKYRIISLKLYSKVRLFLNKIVERIKNLIYPSDVSINLKKQESPRKRKKRIEGNRINYRNQQNLTVRNYGMIPIYFVNLMKYREIAQYPEGYEGKQISGKKAGRIYGRVANKVNRKLKNYVKFIGTPQITIADNTGTEIDWDSFVFVRYINIKSILKFAQDEMFQKAIDHKDAAIDQTYVYASFEKE
jgi:hypothetical protein